VARDPEWEKAAKRDHVREHDSVPSWFHASKPRSVRRRPETNSHTLAKNARRRFGPILKAFRRLSPRERGARADAFRERIGPGRADEREALTPSRARFAAAIDVAQTPPFFRKTPTRA
jgi:hypothetical protein